MTFNLFELNQTATEKFSPNFSINKSDLPRFIVFVAGGERPIIAFSNYHRAERLAIIFARLANARMEVFDSEKEVCYFVESSEANRSFANQRVDLSKSKNKSGQQKNVMNKEGKQAQKGAGSEFKFITQ